MLQCIAACCSVLQCAAMCVKKRALELIGSITFTLTYTFNSDSALLLPCVAVCCSALQSESARCSVLQCAVMCCSVLQCVAVCCRVLQYVAVYIFQTLGLIGGIAFSLTYNFNLDCEESSASVLLQCVAKCCIVLTVCCKVLHCIVGCCLVSQCVAVCVQFQLGLRGM